MTVLVNKLPVHAVLKDEQLKEIDLRSCSVMTPISYLYMATQNLDGCLKKVSRATRVNKLLDTEWTRNYKML